MKRRIKKPPKTADWILKKLLREEEYSVKSGDIEEEYNNLVKEAGFKRAALWYWWQVIRAFPVIVSHSLYWSLVMVRNYVKIALRNFIKFKAYSLINIIGLSIGIACFLTIMLFVRYELSFDNYHENSNRIYRIIRSEQQTNTPGPLASALKEEFPEILEAAAVENIGRPLISFKDKMFYEEGFYLASGSIFKILSFEFVQGNPDYVFKNPHSIVINESTAKKYFGEENPIGKSLTYEHKLDFVVTGTFKDVPENSHIRFGLVVPFEIMDEISGYNYTESWNA